MNDKPVGEQAPMCEFPVVLSVEPPVLAGRKKGMGKSEPADQLFFLLLLLVFNFTPKAVSRY